jgi:hypothetical protein
MRLRSTAALPRTFRLTIVALVVLVAAVLAHLIVTVVAPASHVARADALAVTPGVSTDPGGATVTIDARGTWRESGGSPGATGCRRVWVPAVAPVYLDRGGTMWNGRHPMPAKPAPDAVAYHLYCGGAYVTSVWLRPSAFAPAPDVSREIALRLIARLAYPALGITVNPAVRGLAGLDAYLATTGYSTVIADRVSGFGATVEVEAIPTAVTWDPGDGTGTARVPFASRTRGLLAHRYERRSPGYTITAVLDLAVRWRAAGGTWQRLPGITRRASTAYPVIAARSALVP